MKSNGYAKFWAVNKVHYGKCGGGEYLVILSVNPVIQNPRLYWILGLYYLTRGYTSVDKNMQHSTGIRATDRERCNTQQTTRKKQKATTRNSQA